MTYIPVSGLEPGMTYIGTDNKEYEVLEVKHVPFHVMAIFAVGVNVEATGGNFRSWRIDSEVMIKGEQS